MTPNELQEIFKTVPVIPAKPGSQPIYQYYTYTARNRAGGAIGANDLPALANLLEGYIHGGYSEDGLPWFVLEADYNAVNNTKQLPGA